MVEWLLYCYVILLTARTWLDIIIKDTAVRVLLLLYYHYCRVYHRAPSHSYTVAPLHCAHRYHTYTIDRAMRSAIVFSCAYNIL